MEKAKFKIKYDIQLTREQLYNYIDKDGISEDPTLISINHRIDELILRWMSSNK